MTYYPFGPLAPDRPARLNDQFLRVADGVFPMADGYRPVGQWASIYTALAAAPKGGASFVSPQGAASIIVGTATNLYKAESGAFTSIGSGYSIQGDQRWRFAQFGGLAIATNAADAMLKIDLATFTVSNLGGSPPKFESLGVVKDFLVGTCRDGDIMTIGWCALNNAEFWTVGQRQSDYNIMPAGGRVNGILSGEFGVILQRDRICRMDYVGGNVIFEINEVSSNIGCVTPHSVAQWGNLGFFLSDEGFIMWDGAQAVPIGNEVIDRTFAALYNSADWASMSTAIDPVNRVCMWSMGDVIYCYNWTPGIQNRWTTITYVSPIIFSGVTKGISLDEQDSAVGANDDNLDYAGLVTLDSSTFNGGDPKLYVFSSTNALGSFSGTPMAATFTGNDIEIFAGRRANLRFLRPDIDATSGVSCTIGAKQRLGDTLSNVSASALVTSGEMPVRVSGRYLRPSWGIAAGTTWTEAKGAEYIGAPGAGR